MFTLIVLSLTLYFSEGRLVIKIKVFIKLGGSLATVMGSYVGNVYVWYKGFIYIEESFGVPQYNFTFKIINSCELFVLSDISSTGVRFYSSPYSPNYCYY